MENDTIVIKTGVVIKQQLKESQHEWFNVWELSDLAIANSNVQQAVGQIPWVHLAEQQTDLGKEVMKNKI